jgi:O-antigen ligase
MTILSSIFNFKPEATLAAEAPALVAFEAIVRPAEVVRPNALVRVAFWLSIFAIPFWQLYVPATGGRVGVQRVVQLVMAVAVLSQPRVCLRFMPGALLWFLGYAGLRLAWGFWLTPDMLDAWWPTSRELLEFLPWVWVMFNVLQFAEARHGGLWALGLGCSLCAMLHITGIGEETVADGLGNRSSVFGMNANDLGIAYATASIALLGLWMIPPRTSVRRLLPFPLIAIIGLAMAKTGSRTAILILATGVVLLMILGKEYGSRARRGASLVLLGALVAVVLWTIPTVMERFREINPQNIGQNNPRARMVPVLWEMFLRSPIYGSGPNGYEYELTRRAMPYLVAEQKTIVAHNEALGLLVETGIIGFLMFSSGVAMALAAAWRARLKPCGPLPLALLLPIAIAAVTVAHPGLSPVFWVAMAYALAGSA